MNPLQRLQALTPAIKNICAISGTPGVSIGVADQGQIVYKASFGYRDVEQQLPMDEDTVCHIMSLSKGFTAAALGVAVEEGLLSWNTRVLDVFPEFNHPDSIVRTRTNIIDLMAHRTGLASSNTVWMQEFGRLSLPKSETLATFSTLRAAHDFRAHFGYSNWGAAIAALMLEKVSGQSWGHFLKTRLFEPLEIQRTVTTRNPEFENIALGYMALGDASVVRNERPFVEDGQIMAGAGAVQSSVNDLLTFYNALLKSAVDQFDRSTTSAEGSPFKQLPTIFSPHMNFANPTMNEQSYALGWVRTELPGTLGQIGLNGMYVDKMPVVGRGGRRRLVWHHNGSLAAFLSSVHLLPETGSTIVVLTNSISNNDAADWIGQMVLEALIDCPERNDYEALAKSSAERCTSQWREIPEKLAEKATVNTTHQPLEAYAGKYYNPAGNWFMEVFTEGERLKFCIQGDCTQIYELGHFDSDNFTFILSQKQNALRGRFPLTNPDLYLLRFQSTYQGIIYGVIWYQDPDVPEGDLFMKQGVEPPQEEACVKHFATSQERVIKTKSQQFLNGKA